MAIQTEENITSRSVRSLTAAITEVEGFINDVKELILCGSISAGEGDVLIEAASELRKRLVCCRDEFKCST